MFRLDGGRPSDLRGFLHKSFIGKAVGRAVTTFVPGASTAVDVFKTGRTLLGGGGAPTGGGRSFGRGRGRALVPRTETARVTLVSGEEKNLGRSLKLGGDTTLSSSLPFVPGNGTSPCRARESSRCCALRNGDIQDQAQWQAECGTAGGRAVHEFGAAVMGQYGAALEPGVMMIERSTCPRGTQLAKDGLCYNKGSITNSQRMWPRGRRPLLTGGDMRAIAIAARAGSKLERTTKRLQSLGMMKKPARRVAPAHRHAKPVAAVSV